MSNEGPPILITNEQLQEQLTEVTLKTLASPSKDSTRKEVKKKRMAIAKLFALYENAKIVSKKLSWPLFNDRAYMPQGCKASTKRQVTFNHEISISFQYLFD